MGCRSPGTPAEKWYEGIEEWRKGQYFFSHITEIIRLATLYKYGGVYLDTDVVVMQELYDLHNVVGTELAGSRGESKVRVLLDVTGLTGTTMPRLAATVAVRPKAGCVCRTSRGQSGRDVDGANRAGSRC